MAKVRVDLSGPAKPKTKYFTCPACKGPAVGVRSKTTRIGLVNDERVQISDKKWTHRGVVCLGSCGAFPSAAAGEDEDGQLRLDV